MDTILKCKLDKRVAIILSSVSLSKHKSGFQYKHARKFESCNSYSSMFFTEADGPEKPITAEEDSLHIGDDF